MSASLTDQQIAAALAEQVYRRGNADQPLTDTHIGVTPINLGNIGGLTPVSTLDYYYDDATGFVGRVVEANGKIFVVFRGTDGDVAGLDIWGTNVPVAEGAIEVTQLG